MTDTTKADACQQAWRTMDSAPLDGTEVLLQVKKRAGMPGCCLGGHYMPGGHCIEDHPPIDRGWYFWNGRQFDYAAEPTAWMPIPNVTPASNDDRLDAERYRWLRNTGIVEYARAFGGHSAMLPNGEILDGKIDMARRSPVQKDLRKGEET